MKEPRPEPPGSIARGRWADREAVQGVKGSATLYINDQPAGAGDIDKTVPFGWSLSGEGLCCGFDSETPVSELYASPYEFTGNLERVVVSVSGKAYENVAMEVRQAFMKQ